ncbi:MAG: hypothetical protein ACRDMH_03280 [Solirubrobacterales bacterium]
MALIVCNDHSSQTVYLALGATAIANKGLRLTPVGGSVVIDNFTGAVNAIATGASTGVSFTEV